MFEPARLWTGRRPAASSAAAIIPAVVVLPLVALIRVEPSLEPGAERPDRIRGRAQEHPAGQRGAAAAAAAPAQAADRPGGGDAWRRNNREPPRSDRRGAAHGPAGGAISSSAARERPATVAGRSVRWSPSA